MDLDWHELWVLLNGFAQDDACHLHRDLDPDWEWRSLHVYFASQALHALQGANWQRSGSRGQRPKLLTAQLLRGGDSELDVANVNSSGVAAGSRKGDGIEVASAEDLANVRDLLEARRAKNRTATG